MTGPVVTDDAVDEGDEVADGAGGVGLALLAVLMWLVVPALLLLVVVVWVLRLAVVVPAPVALVMLCRPTLSGVCAVSGAECVVGGLVLVCVVAKCNVDNSKACNTLQQRCTHRGVVLAGSLVAN